MLVTHEWRGQSPPFDNEKMYRYASVDFLIDDTDASISLFLVEFHLEQFAFLVYSPYYIASQIRQRAKFLGKSGQY